MNAEKYNTPAEPVFKKLMYHVASFPTVLALLCLSETGQLLILFLAALLFIKQ